MVVFIGGHRGSGLTDEVKPPRTDVPAESTIESFRQAFNDGADFIEVDAQETADHQIVLTHADNLSHHVYIPTNLNTVGQTNANDLKSVLVGASRKGHMPTLTETLDFLRTTDAFNRSSFCLNIELKNIREIEKDKFKLGPESYYDSLARTIEDNKFPIEKIVFSSFAARDLVKLKDCMPQAKTGFLFWECEGGSELDIYPDENVADARYIYFTPENIDYISKLAKPDFLHPELIALNDETAACAARHGAGIISWVWKEKPPSEDEKMFAEGVKISARHNLPLAIITDYVPQLKNTIGKLQTPLI